MASPQDDSGKPHNRENDNLKPGSPPRPATEPAGSSASVRNDKTMSDPGSGEPNPSHPSN